MPGAHRPRVGIVDPCCAGPYTPDALRRGGLGGTEATVLRVAGALAGDVDIALYQTGGVRGASGGMRFQPLAAAEADTCDLLVVINSWKLACRLRKRHPDTPIAVWLHVFPGKHNRGMGRALRAAGIGVICVSESHARALRSFLPAGERPLIETIHNPIADDLRPDDTPRDRDALLFASSPHKGLDQVFAAFRAVRAAIPSVRLLVADPGYLRWDTGPPPRGTEFLGTLDHAGLMRRMRRSLCLFYPQSTFAETFGLVIAEANATGMPALVHAGLGANDEVVDGPGQAIDTTDTALVVRTIARWRARPLRCTGREAFRLGRVAQRWRLQIEAELLQPDRAA